ncbi:MAG: hypothetical protein ACOCVU_03005 [Desulfohalobiaceae bacterium]
MTETVFVQEMWSVIRLVVVLGFILAAIKLIRGGRKNGAQDQAEEAQMIQEIYQGLEKMESRVESLETLLMERDVERTRHDQG